VLVCAMSMHSIFEGIALGLTSDFTSTINLVIAIIMHKPAEAITLGVSINKNFVMKHEEKMGILLLTIYSSATPLGVIIGMALKHSSLMVEVVFNALAAGTFIYIAASEVIVEEFSDSDRHKWCQFFTYLLGIALITSLWLIEQAL
jgi:zinc transporter 1/2/3